MRVCIIAALVITSLSAWRDTAATAGEHARDRTARRFRSVKSDLSAGLVPISPTDFTLVKERLPLSLERTVELALENNQEIRVAAHKPIQAETYVMEAKSAYDPQVFAEWRHNRDRNPNISGGSSLIDNEYRTNTERAGVRQHTPTGADISAYREWSQGRESNTGRNVRRGSGGAYVVEVSQPLLNGFADRETRTILNISRIQVDSSEEEFRQTVSRTMTDIIETYWSVAAAAGEVAVYEETVAMAKTLLERESSRREEGVSTPLDVHRAREALETRTHNLILAKEQQEAAQEKLKLLVGGHSRPIPSGTLVVATEHLETPLFRAELDSAIDTALRNRPEIRSADLARKTSEQRRDFARHNLLPRVDLSGTVKVNDNNNSVPSPYSANDVKGTDWQLGLSFSMPIGNMKARATLKRADSELSQSHDEIRNAQSIVIGEVKTAVKTLELAAREIPVNERAVEAAERVVEGEWARLELNQVGNRDLLQAQDLLAMTQRSRIQSLARYNIAIVRLLEAEGVLLDRMGIFFKSGQRKKNAAGHGSHSSKKSRQ